MLNWLQTLPLHTYDIREERDVIATVPQTECAVENVAGSNGVDTIPKHVVKVENLEGMQNRPLHTYDIREERDVIATVPQTECTVESVDGINGVDTGPKHVEKAENVEGSNAVNATRGAGDIL